MIAPLFSRLPNVLVAALFLPSVLVLVALGAAYLRLGLRALRSGLWTDSLRRTGHISSAAAALVVLLVLLIDPGPPWRPLAAITCAVLGTHGVLLATHRPTRAPARVALTAVLGATLVLLATLLIVARGP